METPLWQHCRVAAALSFRRWPLLPPASIRSRRCSRCPIHDYRRNFCDRRISEFPTSAEREQVLDHVIADRRSRQDRRHMLGPSDELQDVVEHAEDG